MVMKRRWKIALRLKHTGNGEGHRYWSLEEPGERPEDWRPRISVADESGDSMAGIGTPDDTEDGVLWLDRDRVISISKKGNYCNIPVVRGFNNEKVFCIEFVHDAIIVAEKFGMDIECGDFKISFERKEVKQDGVEAATA